MSANIIIVDDHPIVRQGLCQMLARAEDLMVVGEAGDGQMAIDLVGRKKPDIVLMDVNMPGMDGIEATHQILSTSPDTKVVALSMHSGKQFIAGMIKAGASGYILKESIPEEMIMGIRAVLSGEVYLSATISGIVISEYKKLLSDHDPDSETLSEPILTTKLQRPTLPADIIDRPRLIEKLEKGRQGAMCLISAPAGYGKSILASCWIEALDIPCAWVSLDKNDNDLRLFLNYLLAAVKTIFPDVGRDTRAMANALTLPPISALAGSLINELDRIENPFILVLDDFHLIKNESVLNLLTQLLHHPPQTMHLVLVGRRDPFLPVSRLRARHLLAEIRTRDLRFNETETTTFLTQEAGTRIDPSTVTALHETTEGWVTGLRLAALSIQHLGQLDPNLLDQQVEAKYAMEYLFEEAFSQRPPEITQYLLRSAVLDRFCGPLCEALCVQDPECFSGEFRGWDFIAWLKKENMFLIQLDTANRWFRFHHLFQQLLLSQLKQHLGPEDINVLHSRASAWFAEKGLVEESLKHALAAGNSATAGRLVAQHGFNLVSEEQWPPLERWLNLLPNDIAYEEPDLVILMAWLHLVYSRNAEMMSCLDRVEALMSDQVYPPERAKHFLGHLEAMRALQNYYSAEGERALIHAQRANENIPRKHRYPKTLISLIRAVAYQMIGDPQKAQSVIDEMIRDETLRGGISEGYHLVAPCFFYWIEGDLTAMLSNAARAEKSVSVRQNPWTLGHGLHFSGIAYYHLNELHTAEEKLLPLVNSPYLHHVLNFVHSAFALALIYQTWGRADEANQVAESVVSYALDTKNTAAANIAQAFQAEMALRQGRLAEAARWAEKFDARPFTAMYRFYIPQLTQARVLLAQDTPHSRGQTADLLKQLYDFTVTTHNTRFQIEVLALQALFCDSQGERPAALECLTQALQLAEPGGFIRLFVDLGPRMADLLNQLQKQNVAVGYIESILVAFSDDEHRTLPDASNHGHSPDSSISQSSNALLIPTSAFPIPPSTPPTPRPAISQPLVESLSKRELDVLELLTQRLSNKEIADKLHISTTTIKSHLNNIYGKLDVNKRREAVEKAMKIGIL